MGGVEFPQTAEMADDARRSAPPREFSDCDAIRFETVVMSGNPTVISSLIVGQLLVLRLGQQQNRPIVEVAVDSGERVGTVTSSNLTQLIDYGLNEDTPTSPKCFLWMAAHAFWFIIARADGHVGGAYVERCQMPFGPSFLARVCGQRVRCPDGKPEITLHTYVPNLHRPLIESIAASFGVETEITPSPGIFEFDYRHSLSTPKVHGKTTRHTTCPRWKLVRKLSSRSECWSVIYCARSAGSLRPAITV